MADQMQDQQRDPTLEALTHAMAQLQPEVIKQILGTLQGPAPTAPTPPQQMGLPPLKAAAAAMNPQFAPLLLQQQNAPAQALYQQQLDAFNQAMLGRREALQSGTQLATAGIRSQAAVDAAGLRGPGPGARGQIRVVEGPDGKPALQEFVADGAGGFTPGKILATGPDTLRFLATPEGYVPVSSKTGAPGGYVQKPGGGPAMPVPPAGVALQAAGDVKTLGNLGTIKGVWQQFSQQARGPAVYQGAIQTGLEMAPSVTRTLAPDQDYQVQSQYKAALDNAIFQYVNSLSGKQYTIKELDKFRGLFPAIYDPEPVVDSKLESLRQAVLRDLAAVQQQFPATRKGAPMSLSDEFDAWSQGNAP